MTPAVDMPRNTFKRGLREGRQQIGFWCTLASAYAAEAVAGSGYDWLLLDTEHTPISIEGVLHQLQALAAYDVSPIVRPASNDTVLIKRLLDIGVQSLLIPYVQTVEEARAAVAAVRYPPKGVRGISSLTRATRFGRVPGYAARADEEICVIVQIETVPTLERIEAIAAVDGVDALFVGPGDLAATLGFPGEPGHPQVKRVVEDAIRRIRAAGKPAGILTPDLAFAHTAIACGSLFTAIGSDTAILARGSENVLSNFRAEQ
jgi:4-hydroxy-2-oxoheptanedioate aldolase